MKTLQPQQKLPDSDKVTVNVGLVDLAQVDLLVEEGFYSNRTDLVRAAIRKLLEQHADVIRQTVVRKRYVMGLHRYSLPELEQVVAQGERLDINVLGLAVIEDDVPAELADRAIASIQVLGAFVAEYLDRGDRTVGQLGRAVIEDDVPAELADRAIASIQVLGAFVAAPAVRQVLANRIHTRYGS